VVPQPVTGPGGYEAVWRIVTALGTLLPVHRGSDITPFVRELLRTLKVSATPGDGRLMGRSIRRMVLVTALVVLAATALILYLPGSPRHLAPHRTLTHALSVPNPPVEVVGTLVAGRTQGLRFGTPVPSQGAPCSLGVCWSTLVTARGYLFPVQGSYDYPVSEATTIPWHIAGPVIAGPGVNPRDHFIFADPRSATRSLIWIGRDTFVSTDDGGRHWYRVAGITHRVALIDDGAQVSSITIGLPGAHGCDYYFTYSSVGGVRWRRGGALYNFFTTAIGPQTPSCLANDPGRTR